MIKLKYIIKGKMFVDFVKINDDEVTDHCHLTGEHRGPTRNKSKVNIRQKQGNFIPVVFHKFSSCDCHLFFEKLVDKKIDKVKLDIIPKTIEEHISVTYGCIRLIDNEFGFCFREYFDYVP